MSPLVKTGHPQHGGSGSGLKYKCVHSHTANAGWDLRSGSCQPVAGVRCWDSAASWQCVCYVSFLSGDKVTGNWNADVSIPSALANVRRASRPEPGWSWGHPFCVALPFLHGHRGFGSFVYLQLRGCARECRSPYSVKHQLSNFHRLELADFLSVFLPLALLRRTQIQPSANMSLHKPNHLYHAHRLLLFQRSRLSGWCHAPEILPMVTVWYFVKNRQCTAQFRGNSHDRVKKEALSYM